MRSGESAEAIDLARADAVDHGSGGQEEQRLEERVVPDVQQAAAQAEGDPGRLLRADTDQGQAQTHHDDADVLDAVIGEQPLEVVLAEREERRRRRRCRRRRRAAACRRRSAARAAASGSGAARRSPSSGPRRRAAPRRARARWRVRPAARSAAARCRPSSRSPAERAGRCALVDARPARDGRQRLELERAGGRTTRDRTARTGPACRRAWRPGRPSRPAAPRRARPRWSRAGTPRAP